MKKIVYYTTLYDYYKNLLTDRQKNYFEGYYFHNLTIDEIALNNQISKAAISKNINITVSKLEDYEQKLLLYKKNSDIKKILSKEEYIKIEKLV